MRARCAMAMVVIRVLFSFRYIYIYIFSSLMFFFKLRRRYLEPISPVVLLLLKDYSQALISRVDCEISKSELKI